MNTVEALLCVPFAFLPGDYYNELNVFILVCVSVFFIIYLLYINIYCT